DEHGRPLAVPHQLHRLRACGDHLHADAAGFGQVALHHLGPGSVREVEEVVDVDPTRRTERAGERATRPWHQGKSCTDFARPGGRVTTVEIHERHTQAVVRLEAEALTEGQP